MERRHCDVALQAAERAVRWSHDREVVITGRQFPPFDGLAADRHRRGAHVIVEQQIRAMQRHLIVVGGAGYVRMLQAPGPVAAELQGDPAIGDLEGARRELLVADLERALEGGLVACGRGEGRCDKVARPLTATVGTRAGASEARVGSAPA